MTIYYISSGEVISDNPRLSRAMWGMTKRDMNTGDAHQSGWDKMVSVERIRSLVDVVFRRFGVTIRA
jgi:hypothetical protein